MGGADMQHKTIDELLELLQWIADRQRYRRKCGIKSGPGYADDCKAEAAALNELTARGFFARTP